MIRKFLVAVLGLILTLTTTQGAQSVPLHAGYDFLSTPQIQLDGGASLSGGVGQEVKVKFNLVESPNFDFKGFTVKECVESCTTGSRSGDGQFQVSYASEIAKSGSTISLTSGYSNKTGSIRVDSPLEFAVSRTKSGVYKYLFTAISQIKSPLETPTTDTAYGWHWLNFQYFTVEIEVKKLDPYTDAYPRSAYAVKTKLSCSSTTTSVTNCSVLASATLSEDPSTQLGGPITINICTFLDPYAGYVEDCRHPQVYKAVQSKVLTVSAGVSKSFEITNLLKNAASGSTFIVIASPENYQFGDERGYAGFQSSAPRKTLKKLQLNFTVPKQVVYGRKYSFKISTSPSISGKCEIYRYSWKYGNPYYSVASVTLRSGKGSGSLTWLWDKDGASSISMSIMASCWNSTYSGTRTQIVTGFLN